MGPTAGSRAALWLPLRGTRITLWVPLRLVAGSDPVRISVFETSYRSSAYWQWHTSSSYPEFGIGSEFGLWRRFDCEEPLQILSLRHRTGQFLSDS
jgi:hypothetical protein